MSTVTVRKVQVVAGSDVLAEALLASLPVRVLLDTVRAEHGLKSSVSLLVRTVATERVPSALADAVAIKPKKDDGEDQ